jgi:4-amino-4-deoxy-L-arabinose transferase-like glycosyltransferase
METVSSRTKLLLCALAVVAYGAGLFVTVMDIDAAQYASMSRLIAASRDFWTALLQPHGYLDKPPLLFFVSSLSIKVLGPTTFAYKLPSFLMVVLGIYATFRLGKLLYDKNTGIVAAVVLGSSEGFIYFTNDVRTDALLAGAVIFSVWQLTEFLHSGRVRYFVGGFFGVGLAMLAKGPIGLMVPALAIGSYLVGKRDFKMFFKWYWSVGALIVGAMLAPMLWGLYMQYGLHGIKFFFWTQSFGRITGQSSWHDASGYFFFVHTFLWAFAPWMLLAYYSIGEHAVSLARGKFDAKGAPDMLLLGGVVFPFIALSCSHYKLPHYIFVVFPLVALLTAKTILRLVNDPQAGRAYAAFFHTQRIVSILTWVFALVCLTIFFPCRQPLVWIIVLVAAYTTFYFLSSKRSRFARLVLPSVCAILGLNIMINIYFFPRLLSFQGGSNAAASVKRNGIPVDSLYGFRARNNAIEFYTGRELPVLDSAQIFEKMSKEKFWIYADRDGYRLLARSGRPLFPVDSFPNVHVAKITGKFLFFKTRTSATGEQYLIRTEPLPVHVSPAMAPHNKQPPPAGLQS